ncbi:MAG: HPr family phosphocarrier protein [Lachnospiraceae bacterium]|nr:HPr family phosphocarrier protein [Lachnospiraceae bacterium]
MIVSFVDLSSIDKAKKFVEAAKFCPFDVHLISGNERVDGKSIIGIFSLNLMRPVRMETSGDDEFELREKLGSFMIEPMRKSASAR